MSNKKDLSGGIANLLQGADRKEAPTEQPEQEAPEIKEEPTTSQDEADLLNSVKDEELRAALEARRKRHTGRPRTTGDERGNRTDGYSRTSIIVNDKVWAKIKEISFRETLTIKEMVEFALEKLIREYEESHGTVVPHPEKYRADINEVFK